MNNKTELQEDTGDDFVQIMPLSQPIDAVFFDKTVDVEFTVACICLALQRDGQIVAIIFDSDGFFSPPTSGNFLRLELKKSD